MTAKTLHDKIWDAHIVDTQPDGTTLLYIDRHLVHEVTSPQAFEQLESNNYSVRHPEKILAVADHNTSTTDCPVSNPESKVQLETLGRNVERNGIEYHPVRTPNNGVCHVMAPEMGFTLPGTTFVCGDSHTATHGAFGALAFGIGTSEVAHVLATQTIVQKKSKNMRINVNGSLPIWSSAKDVALYSIGQIGTAGGTGCAIEFAGSTIESLSMDGRMTLSNMAVEGGARVGLVAPDVKTFNYLKGRPWTPTGDNWKQAIAYWRTLKTDPGAFFDKELTLSAKNIIPQVTWGTSPEDVIGIDGVVPSPVNDSKKKALDYMGLTAGMPIQSLKVDIVFIGSCTNGRLEDLIEAAKVVEGKKISPNVKAIVVPGSNLVKTQAEELGLDIVFKEAGFDWRWGGCSMCLAMNDDRAGSKKRVASTSNRNFEGRQGPGARTHLMSPASAAAAAIYGHIVDVRTLMRG